MKDTEIECSSCRTIFQIDSSQMLRQGRAQNNKPVTINFTSFTQVQYQKRCVCGIMQVVIVPKITNVVLIPITFSMDRHNKMVPGLDFLILAII